MSEQDKNISIFKKSDGPSEDKHEEQNPVDVQISVAIKELLGLLKDVTEFSKGELMAISLLSTDKYFAKNLQFYISMKKHIDRKHSFEIQRAFESLMKAYSQKIPDGVLLSGQSMLQQKRPWGFQTR